MSNVFSAKRFGNYFVYDLGRARDNFGLSLLILGLLPVVFFVLYQLFSLIGPTHGFGLAEGFDGGRVMSAFIAVFVAVAVFPVRAYGQVTDRRAGTQFLMLPASTLEKWLSMVLMTCIVLPVCLGVLYLGSDLVMGLVFPKNYGLPILTDFHVDLSDAVRGGIDGDYSALAWALCLNWFIYVLAFALGAMCFRKGKVGLTLLSLFAFVLVALVILSFLSIPTTDGFSDWLERFSQDPDKAWRIFVRGTFVVMSLELAALLSLTYVRMRTIKH